jgi:hypothetical protein
MSEVDAGVYANPINQAAKHEETFVDKKSATVVKMDSFSKMQSAPVGFAAEKPVQWSTKPVNTGSSWSSSFAKSSDSSGSTVVDAPQDEEVLLQKLEAITTGSSVLHKKFGIGTIERMDKKDKFVYVKFSEGEKKFIYPDAFLRGFLILP